MLILDRFVNHLFEENLMILNATTNKEMDLPEGSRLVLIGETNGNDLNKIFVNEKCIGLLVTMENKEIFYPNASL